MTTRQRIGAFVTVGLMAALGSVQGVEGERPGKAGGGIEQGYCELEEVPAVHTARTPAIDQSVHPAARWSHAGRGRHSCCPAPDYVELKEVPPDELWRPATPPAPLPPVAAETALPAELAVASLGGGANTPILGRADSVNRFNLFDNMSAIPRSRMWMGVQTVKNFTPAVVRNPNALAVAVVDAEDLAFLAATTALQDDQTLFRVGTEYAVGPYTSLAFQAQYAEAIHTQAFGDRWVNPQFMFKQVILLNECERWVLSGTLGIQPEVTVGRSVVNEQTTKFYPGVLAYHEMSERLYFQAGLQFGIPYDSSLALHHVDWAVSTGYWLYGNPKAVCGTGLLRGVVTQIEFLSKYVTSNQLLPGAYGLLSTGTDAAGAFVPLFASFEPKGVFDMTVGTTILVGQDLSLTGALSVPIAGGASNRVRDTEVFLTVNYVFGTARL